LNSWAGRRVLVTGGAGFLGSHVVASLRAHGCDHVVIARSREFNLCEKEDVARLFEKARPEVVIHLAAVVGGIGANRTHPGRFFYENAMMGMLLMERARRAGVEKFVCVGTVCSYPKFTRVPFREDDIWNGYPEETNAPYGLAKKMLLVQLQSYRQEFEFPGIYLIPVNLYGPGDNFDLKTSHVIPALIRKCFQARAEGTKKIVVWGSGNASREFLYVNDAAEGIVAATKRYNGPEPVNLGSGSEIAVRELVSVICELTKFDGRIEWDSSKPDGQPRRCLDVTRAANEFGFRAKVDLRDGLQRTIDWYERVILGGGLAETASVESQEP
jgi:GDP-L-fucose synthase